MADKDFYIMVEGKRVYVTEETYRVIRRSEDKEQYFMEDLKRRKILVDQDGQKVEFRPGREISYERLCESGWDLPAEGAALDECMERERVRKAVWKAIESLAPEEQELIRELFFLDKTEQELSAAYHVTQQAVNRRKKRILSKLKNILKNL